MPISNPTWHQQEAYPLQSEMSQHHRVLHTHIFKEVITYQTETPVRRLMVTEVDNHGTERNRQPEFFFNGIIGHVRPQGGGYIDSWAEATRLSNYWRRFYNIDQVHEDHTAWYPQEHQYHGPSDNAALGDDDAAISDLADDISVAVETGHMPVPRLSNYWRRFYNIDQVHEDHTAWYPQEHQYHGPSDNAALGDDDAAISDLADDTSVAVETGHMPVPSQSNQLATVLHNILIADLEYNAPHANIRPWTDAEDHELCTMKNGSESRPSWKTIGLRLRRDPEVCRIRWGLPKQMPEHMED